MMLGNLNQGRNLMGMKQATVNGRLTRDPEKKALDNGTKLATFTVAVDSNRPAKGDQKPASSFFRVTCFGKTAENCANHLAKGDEVSVSGDLELNQYENDGKSYANMEITADRVFFGRKANREGSNNTQQGSAQPKSDFAPTEKTTEPVW